jgi:type IV secretory pathway TrbD component
MVFDSYHFLCFTGAPKCRLSKKPPARGNAMSDRSVADQAREVTVLGGTESLFGMPMDVFLLVGAVAVPTGFVVSWLAGAAIGALGWFAMLELHRHDPDAWKVWARRLRSQMRRWRAGRKRARSIVLLIP